MMHLLFSRQWLIVWAFMFYRAMGTGEPIFNMNYGSLRASPDRVEAIVTHTTWQILGGGTQVCTLNDSLFFKPLPLFGPYPYPYPYPVLYFLGLCDAFHHKLMSDCSSNRFEIMGWKQKPCTAYVCIALWMQWETWCLFYFNRWALSFVVHVKWPFLIRLFLFKQKPQIQPEKQPAGRRKQLPKYILWASLQRCNFCQQSVSFIRFMRFCT